MKSKKVVSFHLYAMAIGIVSYFLFFFCSNAFCEKVIISPDKVESPIFGTSSAIFTGPKVNTHINLGFTHVVEPLFPPEIYTSVTGDADNTLGFCTVSGGGGNIASGDGATVGGGIRNTASGRFSTIAGGHSNSASGIYSSVLGGYSNKARGDYSTVGGGSGNIAEGDYSWAGGRDMKLSSLADRTFVWGYSGGTTTINSSDAFLIFPVSNSGKVGIGTTNPHNLLDLGTTLGKKLAVYQGTQGNSFYGFGISPYTLELYAGAEESDVPAMVVKKTTGNVGIGKTDPEYLLEVNGSAGKPGGGSWSNSSDERLKDVTGEYDAGLDEILMLRTVTFYYKDKNPRNLPSDEEYIGFIAQEVQEVFPEAISEGKDGYLDFNMHPVNVALVNAVKELKVENDALKAKNASLEKEIAKIKNILGI